MYMLRPHDPGWRAKSETDLEQEIMAQQEAEGRAVRAHGVEGRPAGRQVKKRADRKETESSTLAEP